MKALKLAESLLTMACLTFSTYMLVHSELFSFSWCCYVSVTSFNLIWMAKAVFRKNES